MPHPEVSAVPSLYLNFKFRLLLDGRTVAGVSKCSALKRSTEAVTFRENGDPSASRTLPGQTRFQPITLERGITQDLEFERWISMVWNDPGGVGMAPSLANFRRDLMLEFYNTAGQLVYVYTLFNCWPSEYAAMPDLDPSANAVAIQTLVLQNEGWERDASVLLPPPPSYG